MRFDLDTDAMTRATLEAKYFDAVQVIEAIGFGDQDFIADACTAFKISMGQAEILDALLPGRRLSSDRILEITHGYRAGDIGSKTIGVQISRLRKALKPLGIEIATVWGAGYRIDPQHRQRIMAAIEAHRVPINEKEA